MFDLGWTEMLLIGIVALIVIGPKDLPGLFRTVGQFVGKAKGMAREFSSAMNAAADESGVNEISKTIKAASNPQKFGVDKIREATGVTAAKPGSETDALKTKLSDERAANKVKIDKAMAQAAETRIAGEKAAAAPAKAAKTAKAGATKAVAKPAVKKAAPKAAAAKKIPAKTPAKTGTKTPAAKKAAPKAKAKPAAKDAS